jgi:hypothetical protein
VSALLVSLVIVAWAVGRSSTALTPKAMAGAPSSSNSAPPAGPATKAMLSAVAIDVSSLASITVRRW